MQSASSSIWTRINILNRKGLVDQAKKHTIICFGGVFYGVLANVLISDILLSEFEIESHNYIHVRTNTLEKNYGIPYSSAIG